jgi:hypothetical protein
MDTANKWLYGWKLYVNYGSGWEYETFEYTRWGYKINAKAYKLNCNYPQKWVTGRELNVEAITRNTIVKENQEYRKQFEADKAAKKSQAPIEAPKA